MISFFVCERVSGVLVLITHPPMESCVKVAAESLGHLIFNNKCSLILLFVLVLVNLVYSLQQSSVTLVCVRVSLSGVHHHILTFLRRVGHFVNALPTVQSSGSVTIISQLNSQPGNGQRRGNRRRETGLPAAAEFPPLSPSSIIPLPCRSSGGAVAREC